MELVDRFYQFLIESPHVACNPGGANQAARNSLAFPEGICKEARKRTDDYLEPIGQNFSHHTRRYFSSYLRAKRPRYRAKRQ